jgi:hypothetical protein
MRTAFDKIRKLDIAGPIAIVRARGGDVIALDCVRSVLLQRHSPTAMHS